MDLEFLWVIQAYLGKKNYSDEEWAYIVRVSNRKPYWKLKSSITNGCLVLEV
jgi:hypothetical protein